MVKLLLLLIILILVNAFLAASEVSVVSLNKNRLRELAEDGDRKAQRLLKFAEEPNIFLSTIQVGITLAGFLASAAAAGGFAGKLMAWLYERLGTSGISLSVCHVLAVVLVTVVLSYFALLFGELVPRRIAMQRPEAAERMTCSVVGVLTVVLHPAVWLLSRSAKLILKLLHFKTESVERSVTEEEIRRLVDLGGEKGTIDHDEQEWIQNVFRFDDISVRDAMTREADMVCFSLDEADEDIISTIRESGLSRYPVYHEDINDIIGILNARDYLLDRKNDSPSGLKELLREPYFVPDTIHADDLFRDMQKGKIHMAIVIDEYGQTAGIISMEDIIEEIVGNILDEYDEEEEAITHDDNGTYVVDGLTELDDINKLLGTDIESEEYDTLNGYLISKLDRIPDDDEKAVVKSDGLVFKITEVSGNVIRKVEITRDEQAQTDNAQAQE